MAGAPVTITLPEELVQAMDRQGVDRAQFVAEAVRHELDRKHRDELRRSLYAPHPESTEHESLGIAEWAGGLPPEEAGDLVDLAGGQPVEWIPGEGWRRSRK
ncbi:MAG: ribbon-helix-helix domain-containing protein [Bdellovibrionota bacterium]